MKRIIFILGFMMFLSLSKIAVAQTIIENLVKPDNPRAGRVVTLKEEMRIEDTGKDFYIKNVFGLSISPDGSILVNNSGDQALQFSAQGRFLRNLMKKGQGPGELDRVFDLWISIDRIIIHGMPPKIIEFDTNGKFRKEINIQSLSTSLLNIIDMDPPTILLRRMKRPDPSGGSGWKDIIQELVSFNEEDGTAQIIGAFPIPSFIQVSDSGGVGVTTYDNFLVTPLGKTALFISHSPEYLIKLFDRSSATITRQFKRPYSRVDRVKSGGISSSAGTGPTPPKYRSDIQALHVDSNKLWVQTSTIDAKKGVLVDVFDFAGRYVDYFYLKWSEKEIDPKRVGQKFTFAGGFVYFADKTADDLVVIKKCRLVGL